MTHQPRPSTYAGLFFVALATLMHEILLTRIFSVTMLYHFAFVALSLAMFGMTAGALLVYLAPGLFPPARVHERLALASAAFPIALVLSFMTQLVVPFQVHASVVAVYGIALTYAVIAVPFVVSGIAVCLALTGFPRAVSRLYAADLAGAALGCILLIFVLDWSDGPTAVLWVALLASFGAIAFATAAGSRRLRRFSQVTTIVIAVAAAGHTALVWKGRPVFRILYTKGSGAVEPLPLYDRWNSYSRVRVTGDPNRLSPPFGWGLSQTVPPGIRVNQLLLDIDAWAGTTMTRFNGDLRTVDHLKYDVTNIGYYLRTDHNALVIGAGGGRDVLSALSFGARSVTAVDINTNIIQTVNGRYGDFTGHLDRHPRVRFVNDEARSFVARSPERFGTIQISLIDTWAATAAGAFVLGENSLYTIEAWTTFLGHLADDGMLSVSRWYFMERPAELYRTTTLAVEALKRLGVTEPARHIAIVRNMRPMIYWTPPAERPDGVGTILVSRRPFNEAELDTLYRETSRLQFDVPYSPRGALDDTFTRLTQPGDISGFLDAYPINIAAPTDDSPFFFNMLRLRDIGQFSLLDFGALSHNMKAVATLGVLLLTVAVLTAACILFPLWLTRDRVRLSGAGPLLLFFISIGLGFMLIETSQMQRLIIALGHPTYGLSVVLFAMLLSSGLGSFLTRGITPDTASASGRLRLAMLMAVLAAFGFATPAVARWSEAMTTPVRIIAAVGLLFPAGLFMGMAFPLGMTLAARRAAGLTPWLWGLNGAASVLASVLSVCIALTWSISTAFWTGWACYAAAFVTFAAAARGQASAETRAVVGAASLTSSVPGSTVTQRRSCGLEFESGPWRAEGSGVSKRSALRFIVAAAVLATAAATSGRAPDAGSGNADWAVYRGDPKGTQYSPLAQIHAANVHKLRPAWEYHTGDANQRSTMHVNPIVVNGVMYVTTPSLKAVALNAATGREIWVFDPAQHNNGTVVRLRNRGVAYWKGDEGERIFHFVRDRVYAVDAKSGALIPSFGDGGFIDLRRDLGVDPATAVIEMTSPGAVFKNFLIIASRVNESYDASPGHIRAYDTVTGQLEWIFHTIPREGEPGHDTWAWVEGETYGGANAWGGVTIDEERGWVFAATGSATEDFYGGFRKGNNLFANSVLALDATTGERKWHYQTVRHDIWDYDNPPAPILVTLRTGDTSRDAVVQLTKMGSTFVLDRDTGQPLFPVQEVPVPRSTVPGEETSPTQLIPLKPPPLVRQMLTEADLTNITPEARAHALTVFRKYVSGPMFTPPSLQGTITTPGHLGGAEWHGASFDPALNVLYVNVNEVPTINRLRAIHDVPGGAAQTPAQLGRQIYERTCAACHGAERQGVQPHTPALLDVKKTSQEIETVIVQGRNSMPAFRQFSPRELSALSAYLRSEPGQVETTVATGAADRYTIDGYPLFLDQHGVPAIAPPWGTLNAIDLVNGDILWKVPLGEYPQLVAKGIRNTGSLNFGGAVATAGGLIFVAATADEKIRAFEKHSGRVLWEHQLPAGGYATPSLYMIDGKQYVVIAAGGSGKNATKSGDAIIAFALPQPTSDQQKLSQSQSSTSESAWIELFDGSTLNGWVHMNGAHRFTVEDGAIVGRTVERSASMNSFLCSLQEFDDFELELETMIDRITNSGIQIRTQVRPMQTTGRSFESSAGRVNGPQVEIRRFYKGQPATGLLYGEAMGTNWLSSQQTIAEGHPYFIDEGWNTLRIVARGPRIQTRVNGHLVEDLVNEEVYKTHARGFIGLQIHGVSERELSMPIHAGSGVTTSQPLVMKWRNIRVRPLSRTQ